MLDGSVITQEVSACMVYLGRNPPQEDGEATAEMAAAVEDLVVVKAAVGEVVVRAEVEGVVVVWVQARPCGLEALKVREDSCEFVVKRGT